MIVQTGLARNSARGSRLSSENNSSEHGRKVREGVLEARLERNGWLDAILDPSRARCRQSGRRRSEESRSFRENNFQACEKERCHFSSNVNAYKTHTVYVDRGRSGAFCERENYGAVADAWNASETKTVCKVTSWRREIFSFLFPNLRGPKRAELIIDASERIEISSMSKILGTNYCTVFSVLRSPEEGESFKRIIWKKNSSTSER